MSGSENTDDGLASEATVAEAPASVAEESAIGRTLGRYVVVEVLGQGAMGQVLRAYDPKLRREVALKVVRAHGRSGDGEARLLREAHALARLSHPNVVAVYDADVTDRGVAIAMEYVEGRTLRAWLAERGRTWREIYGVALATAAGIAAAHAAGLVHRDIKPDNVLVGSDGRIRVSDFGLARAYGFASDSGGGSDIDASNADVTLTATGLVMGTPAYMAPEQHDGVPPDALADQYAFCVLLFEALHGVRPFVGRNAPALATAKRKGVQTRPSAAVPGWLHDVVVRGLAPELEERWPSVDALRQALIAGRKRGRRRRYAFAVLGVAAVPAIGLGIDAIDRRTSAADCEASGASIVNELPSADEVREAMIASGVANAAETADKVLPLLDAHAQRWQDARTTVCLDTNVRRAAGWNADMLDRAVWCLDERRLELAALVGQFERGNADTVTRAVEAASSLAPVEPCTDDTWLARLPAPPTSDRDEAEAVRADLSHAAALRRTGAYAEALKANRAALARAEALGWPPLNVRARVELGVALSLAGQWVEAASELETAYFDAARAEIESVAAEAAIDLVDVMGRVLQRPDEALRWARHAEVALVAVPDPMGLLEADLHRNIASTHLQAQSFDEAEASMQRALALREQALGSDHLLVATVLSDMAILEGMRRRPAEAKVLFERALAIEESVRGPRHPSVGAMLNNLAISLGELGLRDEAVRAYERALAIRTETLGPEHPYVAITLTNFAALEVSMGEVESARARLELALQINERSLPADHPDLVASMANLGLILVDLEQFDRAEELLEQALAIDIRARGPDHLEVAYRLLALGDLARRTNANADARLRYEEALAILEHALGPDDPGLVMALFGLSDVAVSQHRFDAAVEAAERALAVRERSGAATADLALARFILARALLAADPASKRAVSLAQQAHADFRQAGEASSAAAQELDKWMAEQGLDRAAWIE